MILVDTNIPLRIAQIGHPHRQPAPDALQRLTVPDREHFAIAPQSLYEMYVVLTRPASGNGFGYTPKQGTVEIAATRAIFEILAETTQVYPTWEGLIAKYAVVGKQASQSALSPSAASPRITYGYAS